MTVSQISSHEQCVLICNAGASVFTDGRFGTPNNVSYFQTVSCTGNEVQLKDCNLNDSCSSSCASTIGISCYSMLNVLWILNGLNIAISFRRGCK